jgi:thiol-disulfide isomerase/thioredoxin
MVRAATSQRLTEMVGEDRPMFKPLLASLFAVALTIPGCGKESPAPERTAPPVFPQSAPAGQEIVGIDLDGQPMKLSDYRGKVVALSFWFKNCKFCVDLFPHEKALVEKHRDQPFVLLGANNDPTIEIAKATERKHQLTWRSFYLGDPQGPVTSRFRIEGWPTTLIFDASGELRFRFEGMQPAAVERAVETLLRQMNGERKV